MKNNLNIKSIAASLLLLSAAALFAQDNKPDALKEYTAGNYKNAITICESEITANPSNLDSYVVMCWSLVANKQYSEAEQKALEARKLNAYDVRVMEVLGEAKYYLGKNNEALSLFQDYIANVGENGSRIGRAYYYMGEIYIRQARYAHADISLTAAVRNSPLLDYWWTRLGYAREMDGEYRSAVTAYEKALSLNAGQTDASLGKTRCMSHIQ
jgi:tetratricopeptide (TPR) repeat protein